MARELRVKFTGDTTGLKRATDSAERQLGGVGGKLKGWAGGWAGLATKATAVGVGIAAAGAVAWDFAKAAMEDEAAQKKLARALQQTTGATRPQIASIEKWIDATSKQVAVADDELRPALQRLAGSSQDLGLSQRMLQAALDISTGTGKDFGTVVEAMAKGASGSTGALQKLGLGGIDPLTGKQRDLNGILLEAEKRYGGMAEAAANSTTQGKMDRLKIQMDELKEKIGSVLIPALSEAASWLTDTAVPALEKFWDSIFPPDAKTQSDNAKNTAKATARGMAEPFQGLPAQLRGPMTQLGTTARDAGNAIMSAFRAVWPTVRSLTASGLAGAVSIMSGFASIVGGIFRGIAGVVTGSWSGLWAGLQRIAQGAVNIITGMFRGLFNLAGKLADLIPGTSRPSWAGGGSGKASGQSLSFAPQSARSGGGTVVLNLPVGTDPYATAKALRTYGQRVGALDVALLAVR
jgi:hypothetical protein